MTTTQPPTLPRMSGAELADKVARLIAYGLPEPAWIFFRFSEVQVGADDLDEWVEQTAATDGAWRTVGNAGELFTAQADGFELTSWRPHVCEPTP